jgi:hypothetical protein
MSTNTYLRERVARATYVAAPSLGLIVRQRIAAAVLAELKAELAPQAELVALFPNRMPEVDASDAPTHWYHKGWNDCRTQALHARASQPQASHLGRWFCDGPNGHFWADDLETARRLVSLIDKDDDLTVTEVKQPQPYRWLDESLKWRTDPPTEVLGERCIDGGACHHSCKECCFRRECCSPLSGYAGPWAYPAQQPQAEPVVWVDTETLNAIVDHKRLVAVIFSGGGAGRTPLGRIAVPQPVACRPECADGCPPMTVCDTCQGVGGKDAPQPQAEPVGEWAMVERAAIVGICRILERDGDEHWAAAELRQLLRAAPQPQPQPQASLNEPFGNSERLPQPRPQASAEDVAIIRQFAERTGWPVEEAAWKRIETDMNRLLGVKS